MHLTAKIDFIVQMFLLGCYCIYFSMLRQKKKKAANEKKEWKIVK